MIELGNSLKFCGKWRDYQKRVLDNLDKHLSDKKLHIVAAPGAGKTTLGIEVISRINKPTLILAPTITIRNQWKQRIIEAFLNGNSEDIISTNIREPGFITIITYQALLAAFCGFEENEDDSSEEPFEQEISKEEEVQDAEDLKPAVIKRFNEEKAVQIIEILKKNNLKLCCFDEAHHLRNEWWKALDYLMDKIEPEQTVALTATPPYDADEKEWERYETLCGPIDEIISIPELVKNGDLCPHQDFIHFSLLRKEEREFINKQITKVNDYIKGLLNDEVFKEIVSKASNTLTEYKILENPLLATSVVSYQKEAKINCTGSILETLGITEAQIPKFTTEFQKELLKFIFFNLIEKPKPNKGSSKNKEDVVSDEADIETEAETETETETEIQTETEKIPDNQFDPELIEKYVNKARHAGIISNKTILLDNSPKIKRQIANSLGKLDSIKKIVDLETKAMRASLRMVILADYIKADNTDCTALGVIPIWQMLKDNEGISLAVLTGSIILLPLNLKDELNQYIEKNNMKDSISVSVYDRDSNYIKIVPKGTKKSLIVDVITQMFNEGHITVMVGTQALLGEGWDAPCINSLILSSTVSSYMLSNQMRGRAIRIDKNNPDKISNIWHLATVSITTLVEEIKGVIDTVTFNPNADNYSSFIQIYDYIQLEQRFQGFQAPSFFKPHNIQNGIERVLPKSFVTLYKHHPNRLIEANFLMINQSMEGAAIRRLYTKSMWEEGLYDKYSNTRKSLKTGIETQKQIQTITYTGDLFSIIFRNTLIQIFLTIFVLLYIWLRDLSALSIILMFIILFSFYAKSLIKPIRKYMNCSSPAKILRQISIVTLETLSYMGKIKTKLKNADIKCDEDPLDKSLFLSAGNLTPEENNLLIKCVREIIDPIENPKYLLVRYTKMKNKSTATDYHAVPGVIGQNKKTADYFRNLWKEYIGECKIIYTRNILGRQTLLNARKLAYSEMFRSGKSRKMSRYI